MTKDQERLLRDLKNVRDTHGFALACDGEPRQRAHALTKLGFAEWKGESFGSSFWCITDAGVAELERIDAAVSEA